MLLAGVVLASVYAWRAHNAAPGGQPESTEPTAAQTSTAAAPASSNDSASGIELVSEADSAFREHRSNVVLTVQGTVAKVLADDRDGSPHQRFIVRLPSGLTVLVAHNIDLAPRVEGLAAGEPIELHGEYEWNEKGGVIHWTHHDPQGTHEGGWIDYDGRRHE